MSAITEAIPTRTLAARGREIVRRLARTEIEAERLAEAERKAEERREREAAALARRKAEESAARASVLRSAVADRDAALEALIGRQIAVREAAAPCTDDERRAGGVRRFEASNRALRWLGPARLRRQLRDALLPRY